jgi:ParB-like chromosome segregation protein Spo0J
MLEHELILSLDEARKLEPHSYCLWFPGLTATTYEELSDSIRDEGLLEPIVLLNNQILDGRNRLKACLETDTLPRFRRYVGTEISAIEWVLAKNLYRRQLNDEQALGVVIKANAERIRLQAAQKLEQGRKQGGKTAGRGRKNSSDLNSGPSYLQAKHANSTAGQLAEQAHASRYKAEQALKLQKQDPALLDRVIAGDMSLNSATKQLPTEVKHSPKTKRTAIWKLTREVERCQSYLATIIQTAPHGERAGFIKQLLEWLRKQDD